MLVFWGGLVVALVVVAVVVTGDINREPLDPRSVAPDGARALVDVAERAGADVDIGIEIPDDRRRGRGAVGRHLRHRRARRSSRTGSEPAAASSSPIPARR